MAKEYVEERNGVYYVSGTRVSLDSLVYCFREGLSPESIREEFETLTLAQVYGALAHYLENQERVNAYLVEQKRLSHEARRTSPPLRPDLVARLAAARDQIRIRRHRQ